MQSQASCNLFHSLGLILFFCLVSFDIWQYAGLPIYKAQYRYVAHKLISFSTNDLKNNAASDMQDFMPKHF